MVFFFFFNDTATPEIYPLSLHDALPIFVAEIEDYERILASEAAVLDIIREDVYEMKEKYGDDRRTTFEDRKSTRLNSSHANISYAVFCLKKKKKKSERKRKIVKVSRKTK